MKLKTKLLLMAAFVILAIPLVFSGYASAGYIGDGASHDATTTGWKIPPITPGVNGCLADPTKTSRPDCEGLVRWPEYTTQTDCSNVPNFATVAQWSSVCTTAGGTPISLKDHDRNALQCDKLGGVYAQACNGKWTDAPDLSGGSTYQCLRCHNNTYQRNGTAARWKTSYMKTGHKNMLRKVTAGQPWAGPDGLVYDVHSAGSGTTIDWINATVTTTNLAPATRDLYYIYGDWMAPAPSIVYDNSAAGDGTSAKYTCGGCHTTGYETTNFVPGKEPANTYPSIVSGITGSWDQNGIMCSRCHNVATSLPFSDTYRPTLQTGSDLTFSTHETDNFGVPYASDGALMTALCFECHNSTQTKTDPAGQLKTAASGTGFSGHILGNEFLNSPHAQFTGTSGQIGTKANYATQFKNGTCYIIKSGITSASGQKVEAMNSTECSDLVSYYSADSYSWNSSATTPGSCSTCHDVHQSIVPEVGADEPLRRECGITCHTTKSEWGNLKHPVGPGTPVADVNNKTEGCVVCHMATESIEGSTHLPVHLWRINTSSTYRTFPSSAEWSAGTKIAYTQADGDYTNAVWVDIDLACGQCHGGSAGTTATKNSAPYYSKRYLAMWASGMHSPTNSATNSNPTPGADVSINGMTATVIDYSTDPVLNVPSGFNTGAVVINWGDGNSDTIDNLATAIHTYAAAGPYSITQTVTDMAGLSSSRVYSVIARAPLVTLTVNFSPSPISTTNG
ncbi:MAG: hypothetical protein M1497_06030, partial [Nitrospirae bacterium]|nr:hypothetical protein [Nitrospirota bacterium]